MRFHRPDYEYHVEQADGNPHVITVRALRIAGRRYDTGRIMDNIGAVIRQRVVEAVRHRFGWSLSRIRSRVRGFLSATNLDNASHHTHDTVSSVTELDQEIVHDVLRRIHQSNQLVGIFDLEWRFTIDPASFLVGGARDVKVPSFVTKKDFSITWEAHSFREKEIGCAAFAVNYAMNYKRKNYRRKDHQMFQDALDLSIQMDWSVNISWAQLGEFVLRKPMYKLVILMPGRDLMMKYVGCDFIDPENVLYIVYDPIQNHFGATNNPHAVISHGFDPKTFRYCDSCDIRYKTSSGHSKYDCENKVEPVKRKREKACENCGLFGKHKCPLVSCKTCAGVTYAHGDLTHRCILYKDERKPENNSFQGQEGCEKNSPNLWAYDLEAAVNIVTTEKDYIAEFEKDADGYYTGNIEATMHEKKLSNHLANLVVMRNVFTNEELIFRNEPEKSCIEGMLDYLLGGLGRHILVAHNASGYDTRLIFETAVKYVDAVSMDPIMRGTKFMQLKIGKNICFRDSLLHVKGSLRALGVEFPGVDGIIDEKGHFPHLFNSVENYGKKLPGLPDKKFFDLSFTCKTDESLAEFNEWYENEKDKPWDFDAELVRYCRQDVQVLCNIMKGYHENACELTGGLSPWFNATAPSFAHEWTVREAWKKLELPNVDDVSYAQKLYQAREDFWVVATPNEYWFDRNCLRGGRTDIRRVHYKLSDSDLQKGRRIYYQDICSQYPYQQIAKDFPVGVPEVYVWDPKYYPCWFHRNAQKSVCSCSLEKKLNHDKRMTVINKIGEPMPSLDEMLSDDFFGTLCVTVIPPKSLYHPVLVGYSEKEKKCFASLRDCDHVEIFCTSIEFQTALRNGYKLVTIHRFQKYKRKKSLWSEMIGKMFLVKQMNSRNEPKEKELDDMLEYYKQYGMDRMIQDSLGRGLWGKNKARKQTAKIMMNSAWGKHAERPIMSESSIINHSTEKDRVMDLFNDTVSGARKFQSSTALTTDTFLYRTEASGLEASPNLHNGCLAAALFVPAYGRMHLWEQLNKLGERVLMNDTDSIVYIYDPAGYNIPVGGYVGQWEIEEDQIKHGGIAEFVGIGPKTYGIRFNDGETLIKAKGLSLSRATSKLINFDTMRKLVTTYLDCGEIPRPISIPSQLFVYNVNKGIHTYKTWKRLEFSPLTMKGELVGALLYPFGYTFEK